VKLLTRSEAAQALIRGLVQSGEVDFVGAGKDWRVPAEELDRWWARRCSTNARQGSGTTALQTPGGSFPHRRALLPHHGPGGDQAAWTGVGTRSPSQDRSRTGPTTSNRYGRRSVPPILAGAWAIPSLKPLRAWPSRSLGRLAWRRDATRGRDAETIARAVSSWRLPPGQALHRFSAAQTQAIRLGLDDQPWVTTVLQRLWNRAEDLWAGGSPGCHGT
jgi:hypothetical protein